MSTREHVERLNAVVEVMEGQMPLLAARLLRPQLLTEMVNGWLDGNPELPPDLRYEPAVLGKSTNAKVILYACQDVAVIRRWRRHKVIYTVEPSLAAELADSDPNDVIPGRLLLEQMPHPNPYLALPEPKMVDLTGIDSDNKPGSGVKGQYAVIHGCFLYGIKDDRTMTDTTDVAANFLALGFVGPVFNSDGRPVLLGDGSQDTIMCRMSIKAETLRLGDIIEDMITRYRGDLLFDEHNNRRSEIPYRQRLVTELVHATLPLVLYLIAANADRRTAPKVAVPKMKSKGRKERPKDAPTVVEYGYRLGPALQAAKREAEHRNRSMPTGQRMRPHVRRAHWHTYRTGHGRLQRILRWLPPIPVNADEEPQLPVVHPVGRAR